MYTKATVSELTKKLDDHRDLSTRISAFQAKLVSGSIYRSTYEDHVSTHYYLLFLHQTPDTTDLPEYDECDDLQMLIVSRRNVDKSDHLLTNMYNAQHRVRGLASKRRSSNFKAM